MMPIKRLLDEPGSDLDRVLLEAGLEEEPPKASLDRTLVALGVGSATAITAGAVGGAGASVGGAKSVFGAGIAKWLGGALIASAALGGGYFITQREATPDARLLPQSAPATPAGAQEGRPVNGAAPERALQESPSDEAKAAPASVGQQEPASDTNPSAAKAADTKNAAEAKAEQSKVKDPKTSEQKSPDSAAKSPSEPSKTAADTGSKPKPDLTAGGGPLGDELRMLDVARKAKLAGDNDACLANLAKYSSKFPKGQLASEAQSMKASCSAKKSAE
ncbi:MAG: hypothetical protein JNK04_09240 [Myxococcales bacterium]|nr:hypothetical protein [Myxococcales bacterium]